MNTALSRNLPATDAWTQTASSWLARRPWAGAILLISSYLFFKLQNVVMVQSFPFVIFPLDAIYIADKLLFSAGHLRPEIAGTLPTLSNVGFAYPPGIYLAIHWLGLDSVREVFLFLFAAQLAVPLLAYRLLQEATDRATAFLLAAFSAHYLTMVNWWSPDFLIQPLLLVVLLALAPARRFRLSLSAWAGLGLVTGLVALLKHNEGIFLVGLCGTGLMFQCLGPVAGQTPPRRRLLYCLLAVHFAFGTIFAAQVLFLDTALYFLLPYFCFLILFLDFLRHHPETGLFEGAFIARAAVYLAAAAVLPAAAFLWIGRTLGYANYWHCLFGIGFEHQHLWEKGITGVIRLYTWRSWSPVKILHSSVAATLFLLPCLTNVLSVLWLWKQRREKTPLPEVLATWRISALGVTGIFILYPLEGYHILVSKTLLSLFVLSWWLRGSRARWLPLLRLVPALLLLAAGALTAGRALRALRQPRSRGGPEVSRAVGLPMPAVLAHELDRQVEILKRSVAGRPYYVIDSAGETLFSLTSIVDNIRPQYYIEMRRRTLGPLDTAAIIADLAKFDAVIINADDYSTQASGTLNDPYLKQIIMHVNAHYDRVDAYTAPLTKDPALEQVTSFFVFRRKVHG
ncbi:MAG TPA: hypothetical protein DEB40_00865 [Elusimicrobia bacterium]|nr:hypothetical protein [Elusimicrobiota bacterium]HBT60280.1 hypothetical protein [Elusimicrobiota bacterium]